MHQQAERNYPGDLLAYKRENKRINRDGILAMQHMKANTAAVWIEDGGSQQVVRIHEHGGQEQHPDLFPFLPVEPPGNRCRKQEMEGIVNT